MQELKVIFSLNVLPAVAPPPPPPAPLQLILPDGVTPAQPDPAVNALPDVTIGVPTVIQLGLKGGTPPFDSELISGSSLPAGLVWDPTKGQITGTPTGPATPAGTPATFELDVTDSGT